MMRLCVVALFVALLAVASATNVLADAHDPEDISCYLCTDFVTRVSAGEDPKTACVPRADDPNHDKSIYNFCSLLGNNNDNTNTKVLLAGALGLRSPSASRGDKTQEIRSVCEMAKHCDADKIIDVLPGGSGVNARVFPLSGLRTNTNGVRVAIVLENTTEFQAKIGSEKWANFTAWFDYSAPFKHFWPWMSVHVKNVYFSGSANIDIGGIGIISVPVSVPPTGAGIAVVPIADPCFTGEFVGCKFGKHWKIRERLVELFNTLAAIPTAAIDAYAILGDNFYELGSEGGGTISPKFFKSLSPAAVGSQLLSANGNHDFWRHGYCNGEIHYATYGNTYMQTYPVDSLHAATSPPNQPFFFYDQPEKLVRRENVYQYTTIGNTAFVIFSGVYERHDIHFQRACEYVSRTKPQLVIVASHWSHVNCGAKPNMTAHAQRDFMATLSGCDKYANEGKLLWLEGHSHTNLVVRPNVGWRVGGYGMGEGKAPGPNFGIPYFTTKNNTFEFTYFNIASAPPDAVLEATETGDAKWTALMNCVKARGGLDKCRELGVQWAKIPLA